jgi:hypothetical protein
LHYCNMDGEFKKSAICRLNNEQTQFTLPACNTSIVQTDGHYHTYSNKDFFIVGETGHTENFSFLFHHSKLRHFTTVQRRVAYYQY